MVDNWFMENDIPEKMRVALENMKVGRGFGIVFDGLQDGKCTVDVVYDGVNVHFLSKKGRVKPEKVVVPIEEAVDLADVEEPAAVTVVDEVEEKPKRKQKK